MPPEVTQSVLGVLTTVATAWPAPPQRVYGVGIDVVDLVEFEHAVAVGGERWLRKLFTDTERAYAACRADRYATRFAAKEAVVKALGVGFRDGVAARTVEIACDPAGRPHVRLHADAARVAQELGVGEVLVSLSRDGGVAAAAAWALSMDEQETTR